MILFALVGVLLWLVCLFGLIVVGFGLDFVFFCMICCLGLAMLVMWAIAWCGCCLFGLCWLIAEFIVSCLIVLL